MARTNKNITEKELEDALKKSKTQTQAAKILKVTQSYVSQLMKLWGMEATAIGKTPKDARIEMPNYTYKQLKALTKAMMAVGVPTIGYDEVDIEIKTKKNIMLIPQADWHTGAKWVWYDRLEFDIDFIRDTSNVFTGLCGDLMDNISSSPFKKKTREQTLSVQQQKAFAETYVKELKGKVLWFLNGCHDEWSHDNDGFDLAQYLAHKDEFGYFMGHNGFINLKVGDVVYRLYVTHNTIDNSSRNDGHGLRWVCREHGSFDIGIKAHNHKPYVEDFVMRKKRRFGMCCGSVKGKDRYVSKKGYHPSKLDIPGIILSPDEKEVIMNIDYRELIDYL